MTGQDWLGLATSGLTFGCVLALIAMVAWVIARG